MNWNRVGVVILLVLAAALRLYRLDHYPLPMHQDELSDAYDAYSLVETGADRTGAAHPLVLRALGAADYRPAMYAWLATIPMRVSGFSPAAARLPSAVLGIVSLILLFLFASLLVDETFAIIALALATFSPWHLTYSRLAHQGAMLPAFFAILALWIWQRSAIRNYPAAHIALLGVVVGLSSNAYQATRLVAPLLLLLIAFDVLRYAPQRRVVWLLGLGALLGASPEIYVLLTEPSHFFARLASTTVAARPAAESHLALLAHGVSLLFGPRLLFWPNMEDSGYLAARLLMFEAPFYYLGFFVLSSLVPKRLARFRKYVIAVFIIALIPAVFTAGTSSIRVTSALLLTPLFTAAGIVWTANKLAFRGLPRVATYAAVTAAGAFSIAFTGYMYFGSKTVNGMRSNNVLVQIGERVRSQQGRYSQIFVADSPEYAGLHVAAFAGVHPREFQRTRVVATDAFGWDYIRAVGKYRFISPAEVSAAMRAGCTSGERNLLVARDLPRGTAPYDSVQWHDEKYYFIDAASACAHSPRIGSVR